MEEEKREKREGQEGSTAYVFHHTILEDIQAECARSHYPFLTHMNEHSALAHSETAGMYLARFQLRLRWAAG